jgi:hypothetical protein
MDTTDDLDRLYGLLVALREDRSHPADPDLMDAFSLLADHHQPEQLVVPEGLDFDQMLQLTLHLLLRLADTATGLRDVLVMYDAAELVKSVIRNRS